MIKHLFKIIIITMIIGNCFAAEHEFLLNRPKFHHQSPLPQLPVQSKQYINIANYNVRTSYNDLNTPDSWNNRKDLYFETLRSEDEAYRLMKAMRYKVQKSIQKHLVEHKSRLSNEPDCTTCHFAAKEPFPVIETRYYRIALKTFYDSTGKLCGNFPYPYRLIISLKRHDQYPNEKEWIELKSILEVLDKHVKSDLGAEYTSYSVLQDVYYREKNRGKKVHSTPHFFIHFIFRFPQGTTINDVFFDDPNPYDQFVLEKKALVREDEIKPNSGFIFKRTPDIITTQELAYDQIQDFKNRFPNHRMVGYTAYNGLPLDYVMPDTWIWECLAIAYRNDRFECLDHGVKWLTTTPDIPSKVKDSGRERIIIWAKFKEISTGKTFFVFNTHYDHMGHTREFVESEVTTIKEIAKDALWFSVGERFYKNYEGEKNYNHFIKSIDCSDVRDISLLGHYGQSGSWGGFGKDPFAVTVKQNRFDCDTLDVCFTNGKKTTVLLTYSIHGAYDPLIRRPTAIDGIIPNPYRLASDHFMTGFYFLLQ